MDLKYEIYIAATPERVWSALTSPIETPKVYDDSVLQSTFEIGSPLKYCGPGIAGDQTVHIYGTVLQFEPNRRFSHTCKVGEAYGSEHAKYESRVTYELEPIGACTKLMVTHDHWSKGDPSYENTQKGGWSRLLSGLKTWVETGKTLDLRIH